MNKNAPSLRRNDRSAVVPIKLKHFTLEAEPNAVETQMVSAYPVGGCTVNEESKGASGPTPVTLNHGGQASICEDPPPDAVPPDIGAVHPADPSIDDHKQRTTTLIQKLLDLMRERKALAKEKPPEDYVDHPKDRLGDYAYWSDLAYERYQKARLKSRESVEGFGFYDFFSDSELPHVFQAENAREAYLQNKSKSDETGGDL